jgi:uncharacterized membrane protein
LAVALPFLPGSPTTADLLWGAASGASGGLGVAVLYRAFAIGPVSIAAPVISLIALCMPVMFGLAFGERPSALAIGGMALAACAFPLLSLTGENGRIGLAPSRKVLRLALLSGVLVGGFLVLVRRIGSDAGLVPLVVARLTTVALFAVLVLARRERLAPPRDALRSTLGSGLLDSLANVAYFVALRGGALAIVGTIVSLAPAATVLLARLVLRERWSAPQRWGLVLAGAAIACVTMG